MVFWAGSKSPRMARPRHSSSLSSEILHTYFKLTYVYEIKTRFSARVSEERYLPSSIFSCMQHGGNHYLSKITFNFASSCLKKKVTTIQIKTPPFWQHICPILLPEVLSEFISTLSIWFIPAGWLLRSRRTARASLSFARCFLLSLNVQKKSQVQFKRTTNFFHWQYSLRLCNNQHDRSKC